MRIACKFLSRVAVLAVVIMLAACGDREAGDGPQADCRPGGLKRVGYVPSWGELDVDEDIAYDRLTHIQYAFLLPALDGSGALQPLENPARLRALVVRARRHDTKIGIAVGGWDIGAGGGNDAAFGKLAADPKARARFVDNLVAFVEAHGLDGVDIDWEYPDSDTEPDDYVRLIRALRKQLPADKFLSAAVVATGPRVVGIKPSAFDQLDFLGLMAYDQNDTDHSTYQYALTTLESWREHGVDRNKMVLGVPFYARPSWAGYETLVADNPANACRDHDGNGNHYNGIPTIREKARLGKGQACGIMIWQLAHDTNDETSLLRAIDEVLADTGPGYRCE